MKQIFVIVYFISFFSLPIFGQINPQDGAVLNYTQVLFEYPIINEAVLYEVKVWEQNSKFSPVIVQQDSSTVCIIKNLNFGSSYNWQYLAKNRQNRIIHTSDIHSFSIEKKEKLMPTPFSYLVRGNTNLAGYVANDQSRNVIDRNGNILWQFPYIADIGEIPSLRDLRLTEAGTFTCIINQLCIEIDINGNIIWKAPDDGSVSTQTTENYHHDFRRLSNGNYMLLGDFNAKSAPVNPNEYTNVQNIVKDGTKSYLNISAGTVIEYDTEGKVVWSWNSADFFKQKLNNKFYLSPTRLNAFYLDGDYVYLGFRDISTILKLEKKTKEVVAYYEGDNYGKSKPTLFKFQHTIEKNREGNLIVFNNDSIQIDSVYSNIRIFKEENNSLKTIASYSCKIDNDNNGKTEKHGSAEEVLNGNLLISMGALGRIVEINPNRQGEVIWDMSVFSYLDEKKEWLSAPIYRAHFVPSLYPCYFSIEKKENVVTIINEGEKEDSYTINLKDASGNNYKTLKSPTIASNQSHKLSFDKNILGIEVISNTNNRLIRKIIL